MASMARAVAEPPPLFLPTLAKSYHVMLLKIYQTPFFYIIRRGKIVILIIFSILPILPFLLDNSIIRGEGISLNPIISRVRI